MVDYWQYPYATQTMKSFIIIYLYFNLLVDEKAVRKL